MVIALTVARWLTTESARDEPLLPTYALPVPVRALLKPVSGALSLCLGAAVLPPLIRLLRAIG